MEGAGKVAPAGWRLPSARHGGEWMLTYGAVWRRFIEMEKHAQGLLRRKLAAVQDHVDRGSQGGR